MADYRTLFEAAPTPLVVVAPSDFKIIAVNDAYLRATMTSREEIVGQPLFEVFPGNPDDPEATSVHNVRNSLDRVVATRRANALPVQKYDIPRRDDPGGGFEERWWSPVNTPVLGPDGEVACIIHRVEDVTEIVRLRSESAARDQFARDRQGVIERLREANAELVREVDARKRAEAGLSRSEERYRTLFESIDEGFCIVEVLFDPDGEPVDYRFLEANPAFVEQTGLREPVGRWMRDLEPQHEEHWFRTYGRIARTGEPERFINEAKHLDDRWFDVYAFRVGRPEERKVAILFKDISDRKRAEEALREAKEEAEHASAAKSRFLSTMSHELRTPLTAVVGLADLLSTEVIGPMNGKQKQHLSRIKASAQHLVSLIDEILTFSRSEAGRDEVRITKVDAAEVARGIVEMLAGRAEARGLALRLSGADERVLMLTDGGKVRQILTNLAGNAVKYTDEGEVEVGVDAGAEQVEFRVCDTGPGIPADRLEAVFAPFEQLDPSNTREKGGTGLGLTVSRRLARLLGGEVTAESTPGEGSTFTLRLPRRAERGEMEGPVRTG